MRIFILTALASLGLMISGAAAQTVSLDGRPVFLDTPPVIEDGRVLVPMRGIFEELGATVTYEAEARAVKARSADGRTVLLPLGGTTAFIEGRTVRLETPARVEAGRTLVPLRFLAEALGAQVAWNAARREVAITSFQDDVAVVPDQPPTVTETRFETALPAPGSITGTLTPTFRATFPDPVQPSTVRLIVDERDMTNRATIGATELVWIPEYELAAGGHKVQIDALTMGNRPIRLDYSFVLNPGLVTGYNIYSIQLSPDHPVALGQDLLILVQGARGGQASAQVGGRPVNLTEIYPGVYQGRYTVTARDQQVARVIVSLQTPDGGVTQLEAPERAALQGNPALPLEEAIR